MSGGAPDGADGPHGMESPALLKRSLGLADAVFLGLGSILGTGAFVALGLAAGLTGWWALPALGIAAFVAAMNALSSAQLAAAHPVSGGTYAYGYRYLHPWLGFVAGLTFLCAKTASAAAAGIGIAAYMAGIFGLEPVSLAGAVPVLLVMGLVLAGLRSANAINRVLVVLTLMALLSLPLMGLVMRPEPAAAMPLAGGLPDLPEAAALLFVAFTGYGRIATLGEEAVNPRVTIPRAIIVTVFMAAAVYGLVLWTGLEYLGPALMGGAAPLDALAGRLGGGWLGLLVAAGAVSAMVSVLINLILGLSRMGFAMARNGDLPGRLAMLDAGSQPAAATVAIGIGAALIAAFGGFDTVWSFSAFTVLIYYAIANLAAMRLPEEDRLYPRFVPWLGLAGCLGLAFWVSPVAWVTGLAIIAAGSALRAMLRRRNRGSEDTG